MRSKLSYPKSEEHKRKLSESKKGMFLGVTFEERFGKERADAIKESMRRPMTDEQKLLRSEIMKNKPKICCIFCGKMISAGNHAKWHGANCKLFTEKDILS